MKTKNTIYLLEMKSWGKLRSVFSTEGLEEAIINLRYNTNVKSSTKIYVRELNINQNTVKHYIMKFCDLEEEAIKELKSLAGVDNE